MPPSHDRGVARLLPRDTGIAALGGLVALLLLVGLAVGLPAWVGSGSGSDEPAGDGAAEQGAAPDAAVELPADVGTWTALQPLVDQQDPAAAAEYAELWEYADTTLVDEAGVPADAERYLELGSGAQVAVQAYRGPDGPLVPATIQDPASGRARILLANEGDVDCVLDVISGEVSPTPQVQEMQCRRTSDDLTVRAFVLEGGSTESVAALIDGLWDVLA